MYVLSLVACIRFRVVHAGTEQLELKCMRVCSWEDELLLCELAGLWVVCHGHWVTILGAEMWGRWAQATFWKQEELLHHALRGRVRCLLVV